MGGLFSNNVGIIIMLIMISVSEMVMCNYGPCEQEGRNYEDILELATNFQYASAEYFCFASTGKGLDFYDPSLAGGGPPPTGAQQANLDPASRRLVEEMCYEEIGQLRETRKRARRSIRPRTQINLDQSVFADLIDAAFGRPIVPRFNPYMDLTKFIIGALFFVSPGANGLNGASTVLGSREERLFIGQLAPMEAGQKDIFRYILSQRARQMVAPYNINVTEFTNRTAELMNRLGKCGIKYEGIEVPRSLGAENRTESNVIDADVNSLAYYSTTREILRVAYGSGKANVPGAFFPNGANGDIAKDYIQERYE